MWNRRSFLQTGATGLALAGTGMLPIPALAGSPYHLTILHTNDTHSQLEPFPDQHSKFPGMGGVAARKALIDKVRSEGQPVLLLDAGDIFQGTPYFNFYLGEPEIKAMSMMGYDAATLGNHDFDGGMDNLRKQLFHANFPFVCSNYSFNNTVLNNFTLPYHLITKGKLRIGLLGIGIELKGLVPDKLYEGTVYNNPIETAQKTAILLKEKFKCHLVIALSHLGLEYKSDRISDVLLARHTSHIDIIIGGHTHSFMDAPLWVENKNRQAVLIHQVGYAGLRLGRIDVLFEKNLKKNSLSTQTVFVDKKSIAF